jgi:hypothetical protein
MLLGTKGYFHSTADHNTIIAFVALRPCLAPRLIKMPGCSRFFDPAGPEFPPCMFDRSRALTAFFTFTFA